MDSEGMTPLYLTLLNGHIDVANDMIEKALYRRDPRNATEHSTAKSIHENDLVCDNNRESALRGGEGGGGGGGFPDMEMNATRGLSNFDKNRPQLTGQINHKMPGGDKGREEGRGGRLIDHFYLLHTSRKTEIDIKSLFLDDSLRYLEEVQRVHMHVTEGKQ